jgi:hypothetical protein
MIFGNQLCRQDADDHSCREIRIRPMQQEIYSLRVFYLNFPDIGKFSGVGRVAQCKQ